MGNLKDKPEIIEGVKVTNSAVRCLGIHIGHDKNKCNELNWMKLTMTWKNCLSHGKREN